MTRPYHIELDFPARTLRMTLVGLWTTAIVDAFERDMDQTFTRYRAFGGQPGTLLTLVDLRENAVQPQDIAARLQGHTRRHSLVSKRTALLLSPSAIQRAQAKRLTPFEDHRLFVDETAALAWLQEACTPLPLAG